MHALNLEDAPWLGQISAVFANNPKDLNRVLERAVGLQLGLSGFPVEHPLVDLNPGQPSFFHGLPAEFPRDLSLVGFEEHLQGLHLLVTFAHSVRSRKECAVVVVGGRSQTLVLLFAFSLAGNHELSSTLGILKAISAFVDNGVTLVQSKWRTRSS